MAEEKMNPSVDEEVVDTPVKENKKKVKPVEKKPNFFVRVGRKIKKFFKDVVGEMKKVVWTSKTELKKSTKVVLVTVFVFAVAIAIVDVLFFNGIELLAGLVD